MKKNLLFTAVMLFVTIVANAQFTINSEGKVGISTPSYSLYPRFSVGHSNYSIHSNVKIGTFVTPEEEDGKTNIGLEGVVTTQSNYTSETSMGVLGIVDKSSTIHGRSYGVCGLLGPNANMQWYGGAGVFGSNLNYSYYYPENIQGTYAGYFWGPVKITGNLTVPTILTTSDYRLKENIIPLTDTDSEGEQTLQNVLNMNVVKYNYKNKQQEELKRIDESELTEEKREAIEAMKKSCTDMASINHFGLIAQELKEIYPDIVQEGQDGYLAINYTELVPILIRSIQVLKLEVDKLKGVDGGVRMIPQSSRIISTNADSKNELFQNTPNPFKEKTIIRFQLANDVRNAAICIFDMSGKLLKKMPVSSGMDNVSINGYELGEGMFLYSLLVNGQEVDTKRMILSK